MRILVMENDHSMGFMLKDVLEHFGHEVGIRIMRNDEKPELIAALMLYFNPEIVIYNIDFPYESSIDKFERARNVVRLVNSCGFILTSTNPLLETPNDCKHLHKPFRIEKMLGEISARNIS